MKYILPHGGWYSFAAIPFFTLSLGACPASQGKKQYSLSALVLSLD